MSMFHEAVRVMTQPAVYVAEKRACPICNRVAELMETRDDGVSWYLCPARHSTFVDATKLTTKAAS